MPNSTHCDAQDCDSWVRGNTPDHWPTDKDGHVYCGAHHVR